MLAVWKRQIIGALPKNRIARAIVTLAGGTAAAQIITICAMPLVTRIYSPAQIGLISLFIAFFLFFGPALSLRYEYALLIAKDDAESHVVLRVSMWSVALMSILAMPVLWGLCYTGILGFGMLPWWAPLASVPILFGYGRFMVYRSWALRAGIIGGVTKASIARSAANVFVRVGFGLFGGGVPALFVAELAGAWASTTALSRIVRNHFSSSQPCKISRDMSLRAMKRYIKFPAFETPSTLVNQLALTLPLPMIASLHGATAAGWFGLARALVGIPNSQIGAAVADVFQMELARATVEGDWVRARQLFYRLLLKLSLFGLLPLIAVVTLAPRMVPFVFGIRWSNAGAAAAIVAPWLYGALVVGSLSRVLSVLEVQEYKLVYDAIALILFAGAFFIARVMHMTFIQTVLSLSGAGTLAYIVYLAVLVIVVESRLKSNVLS